MMMGRYVEPGGGSNEYTFLVATNQCGTEITSSRRTEISGAENIIIIQMDPLVQVGVYIIDLTPSYRLDSSSSCHQPLI